MIFFFNDTATTEIYTLSLHDALPICPDGELDGSGHAGASRRDRGRSAAVRRSCPRGRPPTTRSRRAVRHSVSGARRCRYGRSEEHTSELQSRQYLVCRLLLEKKK